MLAQNGKVNVETVEYKGWKNNLKISNGEAELIVTLDVGPRIISYRLTNGKNVLKEYADQLGKTGEKEWMIRGGHRLWTSPEDTTRTYFPDNRKVSFKKVSANTVRITAPPETKYGIQKEIDLTLTAKGSKVTLVHRITNVGKKKTELAPWALTVMAPGGLEIIPLPEKRPHPGPPSKAKSAKDYASDLHLVLWPYFDFKDQRVRFGTKYLMLKQNPKAKGPVKFGLFHFLRWVAYLNQGTLFVKYLPVADLNAVAQFPDRGCNYETFTNEDMLEMESLGRLQILAPGENLEHTEHWELYENVPAVKTEADVDQHVVPRVTIQ